MKKRRRFGKFPKWHDIWKMVIFQSMFLKDQWTGLNGNFERFDFSANVSDKTLYGFGFALRYALMNLSVNW